MRMLSSGSTSKAVASKSLPQRYLASVFLALGFLVVWTGILAGILIRQSVKQNCEVGQSVSLFHFHEKASDASFALGEELVLTVNWLLNNTKASVGQRKVLEAHQRTDNAIADMFDQELILMNDKILQVRELVSQSLNAQEALELYFQINEQFLRKCFSIHQARHELPSSSLAFVLFIQGSIKKFEEIALGGFYLKSNDKFSSELKTKFLTSHIEADELIQTALQFVPKAQDSWWESHYEHPIFSRVRDSIFSTTSKVFNKKFDNFSQKNLLKLHSKLAKKQIKSLNDTRFAMNNLFGKWMDKTAKYSKNTLSFHLSLAGAAVIVLIFSVVVIGCSLREFGNSQSMKSTFLSKCSNSSLIVQMDDKKSFVSSSAITDPTITSLDQGSKDLISN